MEYQVKLDLCEDYSQMVRACLLASGMQADKTGTDLWYDFLNLQMKRIQAIPRTVLVSKEFSCPDELEIGLNLLIEKLKAGQDVSLYLSKDARSPAKFDGLLYDWGIYHLHLGEIIDPATGRIERTGPVLFLKIDQNTAYCINVYHHGRGVEQPWSMQELLKIIHRNWPATIAPYRLPDGMTLYPETIPLPTNEEYALLRRNGITTPIFVDDGIAYCSPGGGYMVTGHSGKITGWCNKINNTLKLTEQRLKDNLSFFVEHIKNKSGQQIDGELHFMLVRENEHLYVVDEKSAVVLIEVKF